MENQVNIGDQNTQQVGQNNTDKSANFAVGVKRNLWMYVSLFLLILLIGVIGGFMVVLKNQKSTNETATTPITTLSPAPKVTTTIESNAPPETETIGSSYGLFYPYSEGVTINNSKPTIIGKVSQSTQSHLTTKFVIEKSPVSGENEYFLRFIPGKTKNLEVKIDNVILPNVYGISQYPTILCKKINLNPDGTSSYDPQTGKKSPPDDIFTSEGECFSQMTSDIPSLIFFAKPSNQLPPGKHILTISSLGRVVGSISFTIDPQFKLPLQTISNTNQSDFFSYFDTADNCSEGYYYDSNSLKIPLPIFNNRNLIYGISFPQTVKRSMGVLREEKFK